MARVVLKQMPSEVRTPEKDEPLPPERSWETPARARLLTPILKRHVQWYLRRVLDQKVRFTIKEDVLLGRYGQRDQVRTYLAGVLPAFREYSRFLHDSMLSGDAPPVAPLDDLHDEAERITRRLTEAYLRDPSCEVLDMLIPRPPDELFRRVMGGHETLRGMVGDVGPRGLGPIDVFFQFARYMRKQTDLLDFMRGPLTPRRRWYEIPAPTGGHVAHVVLALVEDTIRDIRRSARRQGIRFQGDGEIRCFYNVMNLLLHHVVLSGRIVLRPAQWDLVFAASALHVVQDDYVDGAAPDARILEAIADRLRGHEVETPDDDAAAPIFRLIDLVYRHIPPARRPMLVEIFSALHDYQLRSLRQKDRPRTLTEEELLRITFMKGGYAFAFYGYLALGSLTIPQFRHFFAMGAVFQLMDDLHDVDDDLLTAADSVWTRELDRGAHLDGVLLRTLATQRELEILTGGPAGFRHPGAVKGVERIGARYDTFRFTCMHLGKFSRAFKEDLFARFPFPAESAAEFFHHTREHETLDNYERIIRELRAEFMRPLVGPGVRA